MSALTITILVALAILMIGLYVLNHIFSEFEQVFIYLSFFVVLFVIGASAYLFFAMPTFAEPGSTIRGTDIKQDTSNLLQE